MNRNEAPQIAASDKGEEDQHCACGFPYR
jgi:hypothetical protein